MPQGEREAAAPFRETVLPSSSQAASPGESSSLPPTGPAVMSISHTIRLYHPPGVQSASHPLVLLLPWLGAPPRAIEKYLALYLCHGWPVLVVESRTSHFLWPRWGLAYAAQVLGLLAEGRTLSGRPLLVHAFSVGGYLFAQMLLLLHKHPQRHPKVRDLFRGLIYDSLVAGSLSEMTHGLSRTTNSVVLRQLIRRGTLLYFCLFHRCTVTLYDAALEVFYCPPLRCPVLIFYSHNDPMSDPCVLQQLQEAWRGLGIPVQVQEWQVSQHAQHLRLHPQEYRQALAVFLRQLDLSPRGPQAKL